MRIGLSGLSKPQSPVEIHRSWVCSEDRQTNSSTTVNGLTLQPSDEARADSLSLNVRV
jgi:hypothetical protein